MGLLNLGGIFKINTFIDTHRDMYRYLSIDFFLTASQAFSGVRDRGPGLYYDGQAFIVYLLTPTSPSIFFHSDLATYTSPLHSVVKSSKDNPGNKRGRESQVCNTRTIIAQLTREISSLNNNSRSSNAIMMPQLSMAARQLRVGLCISHVLLVGVGLCFSCRPRNRKL